MSEANIYKLYFQIQKLLTIYNNISEKSFDEGTEIEDVIFQLLGKITDSINKYERNALI